MNSLFLSVEPIGSHSAHPGHPVETLRNLQVVVHFTLETPPGDDLMIRDDPFAPLGAS